MPFHPWCFDIFCRMYKSVDLHNRLDIPLLMMWRADQATKDKAKNWPWVDSKGKPLGRWWNHRPGGDWLVANPLYIPGLPELLLGAAKGTEHASSPGPADNPSQSEPTIPGAPSVYLTDRISSLPMELRLMIVDHLDGRDLVIIAQTSRSFALANVPNERWYTLCGTTCPGFGRHGRKTNSSSTPPRSGQCWTPLKLKLLRRCEIATSKL